MNKGILSAIGNTPLVQLSQFFADTQFRLFAKLESFNPGGSAKDRAAFNIVKMALESGDLQPGATVIESSSGNMGIGLAQVCAYFGLQLICVVDPKATLQNLRILEAYGAQIEFVKEPDPVTGEFLQARLDRVQALLGSIENSFWPNQYANQDNPLAHYQTTMPEIVTALDGQVDYLFCAVSTCGTVRGCAEYIRDRHLKTRVFAVDAAGSVIFGGERGKRLIPGHGAGIQPPLSQGDLTDLVDECVYVTDLDCVVGCRRLVRREAILAGGSSGGVLMAVEKSRHKILPEATCVAILPDHGERYLDTIYSDAWVKEHFGDVSHLWQDWPGG
jgi:cysteine synthase A